MAKGAIPNPYCTCDPCGCDEPCVCGLEAIKRTESTWWDRNETALHHQVETIYKPAAHAPPSPESGASGGQGGHGGHGGEATPAGPGGAFPISLTATEDVEGAFEYAPETARDQIVGWAGLVGDHAHGEHGAGHESVRRNEHNGHQIEIRTTYRVLVDGRELAGHFGVGQDGTTHYHGLPNYQRSSAVDLVKDIIDQFPEDFARGGEG
ncbi:MAG: hypothetical protein AAF567_15955 [Actinomycetota bacterium]